MPHLELTDLEAKVAWLILDHYGWRTATWGTPEMVTAETSLFAKVYRAYRGIPEAA